MNYLTSLRGLAALLVVFFHAKELMADPLPGLFAPLVENGYLAVDFFFVLSGFIISYRYADHFKQFDLSVYKNFMIKRVARVYPLHFFVMLLYLSIPFMYWITDRALSSDRWQMLAFFSKLAMVDTWWLGYEFSWNVPSWSISAEFMAYLVFPLLVILLLRHVLLGLMLLFLMLALFAYGCAFHDYTSIGSKVGVLGPFRCLLEFSVGMMVYQLRNAYQEWKSIQSLEPYLSTGLLVMAILGGAYLFGSGLKNYYFVPVLFGLILFSVSCCGNLALADIINREFIA